MTSLSSRNKRNKRIGAEFEIDTTEYLKPIFKTTRLTKTGKEDEGDIAVELPDNTVLVIECKNAATINLAQFVKEAKAESINYHLHRVHAADKPEEVYGAAVIKRRNHGIDKSYVTMELGEFVEFILRLSRR